MKKVAIIIIVALIIFGIFLFGYYAFSRGYFDSELSMCKSISSESLSEACVDALAVKRNDVSICKKAFNNFLGMRTDFGDCVDYYAEQTGNKEACDLRIEKNIWGKKFYGFRDSCLVNVVKKNPDPNICKNLSSQLDKNNCYIQLAIKNGLIDYCYKIVDFKDKFNRNWTYSKEVCIAEATWEIRRKNDIR